MKDEKLLNSTLDLLNKLIQEGRPRAQILRARERYSSFFKKRSETWVKYWEMAPKLLVDF